MSRGKLFHKMGTIVEKACLQGPPSDGIHNMLSLPDLVGWDGVVRDRWSLK